MLLTRRMEFSASHRLWRTDWDEERNRAGFGAEARPVAHGHNYMLEVTLQGEVDPETGMVMNLKELSAVMEAQVARRFDHRDLNDDTEYFRDRPATVENFSRLIFELLDSALPEGMLHRVRLSPTGDLTAEVTR